LVELIGVAAHRAAVSKLHVLLLQHVKLLHHVLVLHHVN